MAKETLAVKRIYKDSVFRMLFRDKEELLSLYNAIYGTEYTDTEQMEITTLENAIYMNYKNDLSCIIDFHLALLEHQSSVNPNMPLRYLMYIADLYAKITAELDIYSGRRIELPEPSFVVLYNGVEKQPERKSIMLSESYGVGEKEAALELRVLQLNINAGFNREMMEKCPALSGYAKLVSLIRENQKKMGMAEAVDEAVIQCIKEGVLEKFLRENRAEVIKMSIYEYDEEKHFRTLRQEGREEGLKKGREEGSQTTKKETALRMLKTGRLPIGEIAEYSGLSLKEVESLLEMQSI